jgi:hypothetical protein
VRRGGGRCSGCRLPPLGALAALHRGA